MAPASLPGVANLCPAAGQGQPFPTAWALPAGWQRRTRSTPQQMWPPCPCQLCPGASRVPGASSAAWAAGAAAPPGGQPQRLAQQPSRSHQCQLAACPCGVPPSGSCCPPWVCRGLPAAASWSPLPTPATASLGHAGSPWAAWHCLGLSSRRHIPVPTAAPGALRRAERGSAQAPAVLPMSLRGSRGGSRQWAPPGDGLLGQCPLRAVLCPQLRCAPCCAAPPRARACGL